MIKIVYIDDSFDNGLSGWLEEFVKDSNNISDKMSYVTVAFKCDDSFDTLLLNEDVVSANIILIDSKLFEESAQPQEMFTGEDFKLRFRKINPYCKVVIVTQNELEINNFDIVKKYSGVGGIDKMKQYYDNTLTEIINNACLSLDGYRTAFEKFKNKKTSDSIVVEMLDNLFSGNFNYSQIKISDIDKLVGRFNEIEELLGKYNDE